MVKIKEVDKYMRANATTPRRRGKGRGKKNEKKKFENVGGRDEKQNK